MSNNNKISLKSFFIFGIFVSIGIYILISVLYLQTGDKEKYENFTQKNNLKKEFYYSRRGDIYSDNGYLLATSESKYDIRIDFLSIRRKLFEEKISILSDSLSRLYPRLNKKKWEKRLRQEKYEKKNRYYLLSKKIGYAEYKRLKGFPIFNKGKYKGGFISEEKLERGRPLKKIAERFIGYENHKGKAGLEGAYSAYLKGRKGERLMQKIVNGGWKHLNSDKFPEKGADIETTINIHFQDKAHNLLKSQLEKFKADHGSVVVMEVSTGEIKAMSNLYRKKNGEVYEKRNYSIFEIMEPGSTFKLMSVLAMLEDTKVNKDTKVNIEKGKYKVYNRTIKDVLYNTNEKEITLERAFEISSNVGIAKLVYENYKNNPIEFIDRLYNMGLGKKLDLEIKGEGIPRIPSPKDSRWSGVSLAWIAYGYEVLMTPLQILTFYNAVANNGKMMKPMFVKKIIHNNNIEILSPTTIKKTIASKENIKVVQNMLRNVVLKGTAKSINNSMYKFAGKTGTAQQRYWRDKDNIEYVSSFVGYFPFDKPKYSCIVVINNPNKNIGYYGSSVALPVFNDLGKYIYTTITNNKKIHSNLKELEKTLADNINSKKIKISKGLMPNLIGLPAYQSISILENMGIRVKIEGNGIVIKQTLKPNTKIKKGQLVGLILGNDFIKNKK